MMSDRRRWSDEQLIESVKTSQSYRSVIQKLNLIPAGGNYVKVKARIAYLNLNTAHFTGKGWNIGLKFVPKPPIPLKDLLKNGTIVQSYKLKRKLLLSGLKTEKCELCGWAQMSSDGRIPLELDHINGNPKDNRLQNLRILCPNCHSLQLTHRGRNKKHS